MHASTHKEANTDYTQTQNPEKNQTKQSYKERILQHTQQEKKLVVLATDSPPLLRKRIHILKRLQNGTHR